MVKAFLIGAGATRAQYFRESHRAPLSVDFFELLAMRNRQLFRDIEKAIRPYINETLQDSNIEEVMTLSQKFPQSTNTSFQESLYQAIYELLAEPTESNESDINRYIRGNIGRGPTNFKILLNDPRLKEKDFFMTLNYDLYLDREVLTIQGSIDYGIDIRIINKDDMINRNYEIRFPRESIFSIYHLHGSLNWELLTNGTIHIKKGPVQPRHTRIGSNICLIPPGIKELTPVLQSIWKIAEQRLLLADELIIIGCSLNPEDKQLIELIKKFVKKHGANSVKIIYKSENTDSKLLDNYCDIVGKGFKNYPYGFDINGPGDKPGAIEFIFS
ncbi:MAG: hypothetical protein KJ906_04415 [Nanoarchaeota archaeon]|nr:hypothetical protein [Nanoarchaeota archaeon]